MQMLPPNPAFTPIQSLPSTASLWRRFGAFVHELLFLIAYLFIVSLLFASFSGERMSTGRPQILSGPIAVLQQLYLFTSIGVYFLYFWTNGRRTLAFKTWQLQLLSTKGSIPSLKQSIIRYLSAWIGPTLGLLSFMAIGTQGRSWWIPFIFTNFLWALIDPTRQFLHDRIAGTQVVLAPK